MEALGINLVSIIIYTVLFVALYLIMDKYFLKKIFSILEKRQHELDKGYEYSKTAEEKLQNVEKEVAALIQNAKAESKQIKTDALKEAESERKLILDKTKTEADGIIEKANKKFDEYKKDYESKVKSEISAQVVALVKEIVGSEKNIDKALIDKYISKL